MLTEHQINALPERIYQSLNAINVEYLESVGRVIKKIDELRPTDVHQLQRMYNYGADIEAIAKSLSKASDKNIKEIYDIFDIVAKNNYDYSKPFYKAKGLKFIPYDDNDNLQKLVKSFAKQTADEYVNVTQHTAFAVFSKDGKSIAPLFASSKDKIATNLSDTYTKIVYYAVMQTQMGISSYNKPIQDAIKALANSGIKTVDYASGYSRRLDSSVRQNILWGIKQCNQEVANLVGEEFGADGREVDYHSNPRPEHAEMGGRQFALNEVGVVIDGVFYPSFYKIAQPLLEEYGCLHFSFSILLGVSEPMYSKEQLEQFKENDTKKFEFEGKEYTGYEGTQLQRKIETSIKRQRELLLTAKSAGIPELELEAREKINLLTNKYHKLSEISGLPTQMERTKLAVKSVDNSVKSGIINTYYGKPLLQKNNSIVPQKTAEKIQSSLDTITQNFKGLREFISDVSFEKIESVALNNFSVDNRGNIRNDIVFDVIWFSNEKVLLEKLREDYVSKISYETEDIRSLVAHELGHAAHNLLALKRIGWEQGKQLNQMQVVLFEQERNKIIQECYMKAFEDEGLSEIKAKKYLELGHMTKLEIELISQSFGNYFFGKNSSQIASAIVDFFKKELR